MTIVRDDTAWIHPTTVFDGEASVGFCSRVGHDATPDEPVRIGDGVRIGAFCIVEAGAQLGARVEVDHYCRIACGVRVGAGTRILYRAQVFDEVTIGQNCIIAGELVDRTVVGNNVTFQGNTAHSHADPTRDWDETEELSPVIESGSVVGVGAVLIGNVRIGPRAYVAAGERVTCDVPEEMVLRGGELRPLSDFRGMIKVREA
jgi:UDP-3-O-[3-hydroxymyristoyl] glucosamine N-acyltransferase